MAEYTKSITKFAANKRHPSPNPILLGSIRGPAVNNIYTTYERLVRIARNYRSNKIIVVGLGH